MLRSRIAFVALIGALLVGTTRVAGQTPAEKLADARRLLGAGQTDSAVTLLHQLIEQEPGARVSAYVWLGVAHFIAERDSLARAAFRAAFMLDTALVLQGFAALDAERLPRLLDEERLAARAAMSVTTPPTPDGLPEARCLPGCVGLALPPEFGSMPRVSFPENLREVAGALNLAVRLIVDTAGRVEPRSILIVRTNVGSMSGEIIRALADARFRPGRTPGGPTRTLVELTFTSRSQGVSISAGRAVPNYVLGPPLQLR